MNGADLPLRAPRAPGETAGRRLRAGWRISLCCVAALILLFSARYRQAKWPAVERGVVRSGAAEAA